MKNNTEPAEPAAAPNAAPVPVPQLLSKREAAALCGLPRKRLYAQGLAWRADAPDGDDADEPA